MTKVIENIEEWILIRNKISADKKIGFVPTMGALHKGHISLVNKSVEENDITVVSIFVNPTQFNDRNDFEKYPSTFKEDFLSLKENKVDYIFFPDYNSIYPDDYTYNISETKFSNILCGAHRPGHFDGVLTIVMKLLNIVNADRAYFGEKDFQQYKLINGMAKAFFMKTKIVPMPIIREDDGLAMSSRNARLTIEERIIASEFPKTLMTNKSITQIKEELTNKGFTIDYIEEYEGRRFGAVHLGNVRLIDNVQI